jgi:hypothetical protein
MVELTAVGKTGSTLGLRLPVLQLHVDHTFCAFDSSMYYVSQPSISISTCSLDFLVLLYVGRCDYRSGVKGMPWHRHEPFRSPYLNQSFSSKLQVRDDYMWAAHDLAYILYCAHDRGSCLSEIEVGSMPSMADQHRYTARECH